MAAAARAFDASRVACRVLRGRVRRSKRRTLLRLRLERVGSVGDFDLRASAVRGPQPCALARAITRLRAPACEDSLEPGAIGVLVWRGCERLGASASGRGRGTKQWTRAEFRSRKRGSFAPIAQLDRASDFGSECRGFESLWACSFQSHGPEGFVQHSRAGLASACGESHWWRTGLHVRRSQRG
jgi:hypothetical protein